MLTETAVRTVECSCGQSHGVDRDAWERVVVFSCTCGRRWGALRGTLYEVGPRTGARARPGAGSRAGVSARSTTTR